MVWTYQKNGRAISSEILKLETTGQKTSWQTEYQVDGKYRERSGRERFQFTKDQ